MKNKVSISKIRFVIGDKELELTPDEALALKDLLNETLGKDKTVFVSPVVVDPFPRRPYPIWRYNPPQWTIATSNNTGVATYRLYSGG